MKICHTCKIEQNKSNFYISKKSGIYPECKTCSKLRMNVYYYNNKDKVKANSKKWSENNPEIRNRNVKRWRENNSKRIVELARNRYKKDSELIKESNRNRYLKRHYNLSAEEYDIILKKQNNVCLICGQVEVSTRNDGNGKRRLSVDHCHKTGKVRGLLCSNCNKALGGFKDSTTILEKAIEYLKNNS